MSRMDKWDNGVYRSGAMDGIAGATAGCGIYTVDASWTCTEHMTWGGHELHVAGSSERVCEVWYMDDDNQEVRLWGRNGLTGQLTMWPDALKSMETDDRFFTPATDDEIEAAREALAKLLEGMEA